KEKERAHALTAAQFGMAHGMAAAKIWSTAKDWKEGLAESIGVSVGLFAQEIKAHAEINKYEQGTRYARGGRSLVGEREAEVVDIPVGSRVTPLSKMNQPIGGNTTNLYLQVQDNTGNISRMVLKEMRNGEGDRLTDHIIGLTKRAM
ncbi:MAG TPA: hypothetical protein VHO70_18640, partial [Chitinispirillaceae bacterium]|nr:hypothetical protein [Chitinispirillaceae bacterium]